jgi:hypothetical protein
MLLMVASLACFFGYVALVNTVGRAMSGYFDGSEPLAFSFLASAVAAPVLYVVRLAARARLRGTGKDAFAGLRRWFSERPRAARALSALPTLLGLLFTSDPHLVDNFVTSPYTPAMPLASAIGYVALLGLAPALALGLLGRGLIQGLFAPLEGKPLGQKPIEDPEQLTFSAVAVTLETRGAVGAVLALSVAVLAVLSNMELRHLDSSAGAAGLSAYIAAMLATAGLFQRVSRIDLGFDGVLVTGSSRTRFFAYHDVDAVEALPWGDVVLRRNGRVVLRLQLHGADEGRHAAIAQRVREGIDRAREARTGGAARLADARDRSPLARAAEGLGSFRAPGVTRDELWELVEAPGTDAASRAAAAEALAASAGASDRRRMRVAAQRCAEPRARAVLARIAAAEEDEAEDDQSPTEARRLRLRSPAG